MTPLPRNVQTRQIRGDRKQTRGWQGQAGRGGRRAWAPCGCFRIDLGMDTQPQPCALEGGGVDRTSIKQLESTGEPAWTSSPASGGEAGDRALQPEVSLRADVAGQAHLSGSPGKAGQAVLRAEWGVSSGLFTGTCSLTRPRAGPRAHVCGSGRGAPQPCLQGPDSLVSSVLQPGRREGPTRTAGSLGLGPLLGPRRRSPQQAGDLQLNWGPGS